MSTLITNETACPFCQHPNEAEVWSSINTREDPELKDLLLGGELNMMECQACREYFYAEHFLLYHDQDMELIAFVYPNSHAKEKQRWEEKTREDFARAQENSGSSSMNYAPVTLFGLDELVALVEDEEEIQIQGEIVKHLAREYGLETRVLRPSQARPLKLPTILPFSQENHSTSVERLTRGLERLGDINDRLSVYGKLTERLQKEVTLPSQLEPLLK